MTQVQVAAEGLEELRGRVNSTFKTKVTAKTGKEPTFLRHHFRSRSMSVSSFENRHTNDNHIISEASLRKQWKEIFLKILPSYDVTEE